MSRKNKKCYICGEPLKYDLRNGLCQDCDNKYLLYKDLIVNKNKWLIDRITIDMEEVKTYKEVYEKVQKKLNMLESKRKYAMGDRITSVDEMINQPVLYVNGKIWNSACFKNLQLSTISHSKINYAIRKDQNNNYSVAMDTNKEQKMKPKNKFKDIDELLKYAEYYENILGLQSWNIKYSLDNDLDNDNWAGQCETNFQGRKALITIRKDTDNFSFKTSHEETLIHELLHCKFQIIDFENTSNSIESRYFIEKEHQLLEDMAKAIYLAKYNLTLDCFMEAENDNSK